MTTETNPMPTIGKSSSDPLPDDAVNPNTVSSTSEVIPVPGENDLPELPETGHTLPALTDVKAPRRDTRQLLLDLAMVVVLVIAALFRLLGTQWGEYQYLHPDERFLVWVGADIAPIGTPEEKLGPPPRSDRSAYGFEPCEKWGGYFDANCSPLNPQNRGHGFYVYGTLPMFLTRYLVQWVFGYAGWNEMSDVGRMLSAIADLLTVYLVFLVGTRLYDKRVGVLAAAFSALAVLQIQQSHFFTMDNFSNVFMTLAIYFAVRIAGNHWVAARSQPVRDQSSAVEGESASVPAATRSPGDLYRPDIILRFFTSPDFWYSVAFGLSLGCAVASKINTAPVAILLPLAFAIRWVKLPKDERFDRGAEMILALVVAAIVSLLAFRIFQPYAFSGPGFFGVKPSPLFIENIKAQQAQAYGDAPPSLQWARRSVFFSGANLVQWGLGIPLGVLAWIGFLWAGWRMLTGEWQRHILIWVWTALYFTWQSLQPNPTMRYQLSIYPTLVIFAAWAVVALYDAGKKKREAEAGQPRSDDRYRFRLSPSLIQACAWMMGVFVLLATFAYALAFLGIYLRPITRIEASRWIYQNVPGPVNLRLQLSDGSVYNQPLSFSRNYPLQAGQPYIFNFTAAATGLLQGVYIPHILDQVDRQVVEELQVTVSAVVAEQPASVVARLAVDPPAEKSPLSEVEVIPFDLIVPLEKGVNYTIKLELLTAGGIVSLEGATVANEGEWDDGLPVRVDGYDAYSGIYVGDVNFNMYWDDNAEKLERFYGILDTAEYLFISSNRQWGSLPRIPERFPMVTLYYRNLLGCPPERDILWCYSVAKPGQFRGSLGFELVQVFQSDPQLGPFRLNDQFAEEAFTVYDHPKVMIFRKTEAYDPQQVRDILGQVDFSQVIRLMPQQAAAHPADLMLPTEQLTVQRAGGTWSALFDTDALYNRYPFLAMLVWYVGVTVMGLLAYPLVRLALPGLPDHGYPLARTAGMLLFSYLAWLFGSLNVPVTRLTLGILLLAMALGSAALAYIQREALAREWRSRWRYFLMIEGLILAFFVFDLLIRLGNPDLWHPWKGGEKPMDFAYFNAVIKSTTFPPYDPWFSGGYLNYYYYGFVFVGMLVKTLGIVPSIAYNLILPTIFSLVAIGAFSVAWNLVAWIKAQTPQLAGTQPSDALSSSDALSPPDALDPPDVLNPPSRLPFFSGLAAALGMAVLGNLGIVAMMILGWQRLVASDEMIRAAGLLTRLSWALQGIKQVVAGAAMPYPLADWYWTPSRVMPPGDLAITEFPFFTFLYGDPHAHMFAMAIAMLALSWAVSIVLASGLSATQTPRRNLGVMALSFGLGGCAIGALYPTNTWDLPTYLALGVVAVGYAFWRPAIFTGHADSISVSWRPGGRSLLPDALYLTLPESSKRILKAGMGILTLVALSFLLYRPFTYWFGQGYSAVESWPERTPLGSYFTHWGLFLFVFVTWLFWETHEWMASTPLSSLRKLQPYAGAIWGAVITFALLSVAAVFGLKVSIAWLALPLAAWAGLLILRPDQSDAKRIVLFLIGTGLVMTLVVDVVHLKGDIGRQNTVFKLYLQTWTLFAVSAAAALGWLWPELKKWLLAWRLPWKLVFVALVAGAALYPLMGGLAKIKDRGWIAPHTLDGMDYMQYASSYDNLGTLLDLRQDYRAIRWMQENVVGSPVIVEAASGNQYYWFARFSIYTGLPAVVGWQWHQQQQHISVPGDPVSRRVIEVGEFYQTLDIEQAQAFLRKYDVRYIIVGSLERGFYPGDGLEKFPAYEGMLWQTVYAEGDMVIYEVIK